MKSFIACLLLTLSASLLAGEKRIELKRTATGMHAYFTGEFGVNLELERAFVLFKEGTIISEVAADEYRLKVPGLSYKEETAQIIYQDDEFDVVCATVRTKVNFLKPTRIRPTGKCKFVESVEQKKMDNGFELFTTYYYVFDLVISDGE